MKTIKSNNHTNCFKDQFSDLHKSLSWISRFRFLDTFSFFSDFLMPTSTFNHVYDSSYIIIKVRHFAAFIHR